MSQIVNPIVDSGNIIKWVKLDSDNKYHLMYYDSEISGDWIDVFRYTNNKYSLLTGDNHPLSPESTSLFIDLLNLESTYFRVRFRDQILYKNVINNLIELVNINNEDSEYIRLGGSMTSISTKEDQIDDLILGIETIPDIEPSGDIRFESLVPPEFNGDYLSFVNKTTDDRLIHLPLNSDNFMWNSDQLEWKSTGSTKGSNLIWQLLSPSKRGDTRLVNRGDLIKLDIQYSLNGDIDVETVLVKVDVIDSFDSLGSISPIVMETDNFRLEITLDNIFITSIKDVISEYKVVYAGRVVNVN